MVKRLQAPPTSLYGLPSPITAQTPPPVIAQRAPTSLDTGYPNGQMWVDQSGDGIYGLIEVAGGVATWSALGGGAFAVATLTGDSGMATPIAGNINILTGANLTSAGAADAITIDLDTTISGITSITSGTFVTSSATLGTTYTTNTITATGSDANIDISLVPKGTGVVLNQRSAIGSPVSNVVFNTDNTNAASNAVDIIATNGATSGDAFTTYSVSAVQDWSVGIDNANSDRFSISSGPALSATPAITVATTSLDVDVVAGNLSILGAAKQLKVEGGAATDFVGQATLVNGVATVLNTNIAATDRIFVTRSAKNGSTAYGVPEVVITPATNFVITACKPADTTTETNDQSTFDYFIVGQL